MKGSLAQVSLNLSRSALDVSAEAPNFLRRRMLYPTELRGRWRHSISPPAVAVALTIVAIAYLQDELLDDRLVKSAIKQVAKRAGRRNARIGKMVIHKD